MEPVPSEPPFLSTLGRYLEDTWLEQEDTWRQCLVNDTNQIWTDEILCTPVNDPPALASLPTSLLSPAVSNLASPPRSEFDPIGVAASEGIEAADAGPNRPDLDLKDSNYGGEYGLETMQQSLGVAFPAYTAHRRSLQRALDHLEAFVKSDPFIPATLGGGGIIDYKPASRASYCHPKLGDPGAIKFWNPVWREFSRGNSTGARINACAKGPKRGRRSRNWTGEEKDAFLEMKVEAQTAVKGKDWDFISEALKDRYDFLRSAKSCEDLWGTLLKPFKVIQDHESMNHSSDWCSYWELDENGRSERQLPKSFSFKWYKMIESIRAGSKGKRAAGDQQWTTKDPGLTSLGGACEYSSLLRLKDLLINPQRDLPETSTSNTLTMSKEGLGPYLQSVVIDALQSALKPLATILQCEDEEKQEFDAKVKALDKKRRALDLEEIQIKRQRLGQHQRSSRLTCRHKQQAEIPVKKASVKNIIPAFTE